MWVPNWFIDTNIHDKFQQPGRYDLVQWLLYNTHTEKTLVAISLIRMELMLSEYILDQYLTLISDVISCVEEEHKIMSTKGFFKQFMPKK